MKKTLQIAFFVSIFINYILLFLFLWLGLYPEDAFQTVISKTSLITPFIVLLTPLLSFLIFVLGYDPRLTLLKRVRESLLRVIQVTKPLLIAQLVLVCIIVVQVLSITRLLARPSGESLNLLMKGDFENAAKLSEGEEVKSSASRIIRPVAQAEIEAKRFLSTSDNPSEMIELQKELAGLDTAFAPLWHRYLVNRGLGRVHFCRKDHSGLVLSFDRSERLGRWLGSDMAGSARRAKAENIFSLSRREPDAARAKHYLEEAKSTLQDDFSLLSQRLLGSIYYVEGDFGGATRIWQAVLDRSHQKETKGMELPDSGERKRLYNNIALARLQQAQPNGAMDYVEKGIAEPWDGNQEAQRTEQVRLMATKILCLLALNKPADALTAFEERAGISKQLREEGLSTGSLLLKANILAAKWRSMAANDSNRKKIAEDLLLCLLMIQDPKRDVNRFSDHSSNAYRGLVAEARTLWRWNGIAFDEDGCKHAILSLLR